MVLCFYYSFTPGLFLSLQFSLSGKPFSIAMYFTHVMDDWVEIPLDIHLLLPPQGKPAQPLIVGDIAKHRLHRPQAFIVDQSAQGAVYLFFHPLRESESIFSLIRLAMEESHLPYQGLVRHLIRVRN